MRKKSEQAIEPAGRSNACPLPHTKAPTIASAAYSRSSRSAGTSSRSGGSGSSKGAESTESIK